MAKWTMTTTDEEIDAAIEAADSRPERPKAISAEYVGGRHDLIVLRLNNGARLAIPREQLQGLQEATEAQLSEIEVHAGVDIAWPRLDVNHYLPALLEHRYGSDRWMDALVEGTIRAVQPSSVAA